MNPMESYRAREEALSHSVSIQIYGYERVRLHFEGHMRWFMRLTSCAPLDAISAIASFTSFVAATPSATLLPSLDLADMPAEMQRDGMI